MGPLWYDKSTEQLVVEMNKALRESKEMSEQEKIEYDAKYGYIPDETQQDH